MRIYVCVKHVPDTAINIKIINDKEYDPEVKCVPNPYDEYGVEEAVSLVEKAKQGEVVALCVGSESAVNTLKSVMAMGVHRSILIKTDDPLMGSERVAGALAQAILAEGLPDLIFMGKQSVDSEGMQTPYRLGALLNLPVVMNVTGLSLETSTARIVREIGGGAREILGVKQPCILGATKGLNEPRYPKLPDILKAKKKEIKRLEMPALGIKETVHCRLTRLEPVQERSHARILEGTVEEMVDSLVKILREEEKVM
jgi:electron transfer flavoprotein beta subunit